MKTKIKFVLIMLILLCTSCKQKTVDKLEININSIKGDININNGYLVIEQGGVYTLRGLINNGSVVIRTKEDVKLILDGIKVKSDSNGAVVLEEKANLIIESEKNSNNYLEDSNKRGDGTKNYNATIYSKGKLTLQGEGYLEVRGNYNDGINCKKSVSIKSGNYKVVSKQDGIQASNDIIIENGNFEINTIGYEKIDSSNYAFGGYDKTSDGSKKGLKTDENIYINDGMFVFYTIDDAIYSKKEISVIVAKMNINTYDDAIHADNKITIENGEYVIERCYEGIEAVDIVIENGSYRINAMDDGINANSKYKEEKSLEDIRYSELVIHDGDFIISAYGDGIDSNGNITINMGNFVIDCTEDVLDYDNEINVFDINLIGFSTEFLLLPNNFNTSTNMVIFNFNKQVGKNSKINIIGSDTNLSYVNRINAFSILIINSGLKNNYDYYIEVNDEKVLDFSINQKLMYFGRERG